MSISQMIETLPHIGETLSLLTAVAWAFAVILFKKSGETVHPVALNLYKNILAMILVLPTIPLFGETLFRSIPTNEYLLLLASGALGIGVADTLFFKSLNLLGAGLVAIVDCLYSPFIIGLSLVWLGDSLTVWQVVGVIMIISAVMTATSKKGSGKITRRNLWLGILFGVLAMATMAVGIVMIKPLLNRSPLLWVTEVRMVGGVMVLAVVLALHRKRRAIIGTIITTKGWRYTLSGSFVGAYLSMILWLAGMKYTYTSIAAAVSQTSNIFIFILAAVFLHEPINRQRMAGIILGVAGVLLVTFA